MKCGNCPIISQTADGKTCGRCWNTLVDGSCPTHGDVIEEVRLFESTGLCVIENRMRKRKGLSLLGGPAELS